MFRSQTYHNQGDTIFLLTSVTKFYFVDVDCSSMPAEILYLPDYGQSVTETCKRSLEF